MAELQRRTRRERRHPLRINRRTVQMLELQMALDQRHHGRIVVLLQAALREIKSRVEPAT